MIDFYYTKLDTKVYLIQVQKQYELQEQYVQYLNNEIIKNPKNNNNLLNIKMTADKNLVVYKKQIIDATELLRNNPEGIVVATALVVKHHDVIYVLIDGYNKDLHNISAKHLMLWKIIQKYAGSNYKYFNLGGIPNVTIKNDNQFKGLMDFKLAFNPQVREYIGDFELITSKTLYFMYSNSLVKGLFR
jgi:lipid II:glycine glycyltransferase (peptidoglycan interpeptide bridge formation enzyme)